MLNLQSSKQPEWLERVPKFKSKYQLLDYVRTLDPIKDCQEIVFLGGCYEFPLDTLYSLQFAMLRTFPVPNSSTLLAKTGEFVPRTQKRYADTLMLLAEIMENGYTSERGKAALRRINQLHHRHSIPNEEYIYILSAFVFEP